MAVRLVTDRLCSRQREDEEGEVGGEVVKKWRACSAPKEQNKMD